MAYLNMEYFIKYVLLGPTADDVNIKDKYIILNSPFYLWTSKSRVFKKA